MSNYVYKVNHIYNDKINSIIVYYGKKVNESEKQNVMLSLFTKWEMDKINHDNTNVIFSEQLIHFDDTIHTIKIKILSELKNMLSLEEIYLYCLKREKINTINLYKSLTQNGKLELTYNRLMQFLKNIVSYDQDKKYELPQMKDSFTYNDIVDLNINNELVIIKKIVGQSFFISENDYPFIVDPFQNNNIDYIIDKFKKNRSTMYYEGVRHWYNWSRFMGRESCQNL